jgi:oxygen-independent coproporphyrinogen-3 oxidase
VASFYLHIPFCEHKCIYCDFYSIESLDPMDAFVQSLKKEIGMYAHYSDETFETIFFGGGTPSLLSPGTTGEIITLLRDTFDVAADAEITLETNPGTVDRKRLEGFQKAGINRLSFGVQSFHEDDLKFLTRIHSAMQAEECVRFAREAGFTNISLDFIFSLPGQTFLRWDENLRRAIALQPNHISAYSLIVEKNTPLARMVEARQVSTLPAEQDAELYEHTMSVLAEAGYEHYEVSNYAKPGFRSRHNCNYWNHANYVGVGPSAHSFWMGKRWWNISNLRSYLEKISNSEFPVVGEETLTADELLDEAVMLGLRSTGVDLENIKRQHGIDLLEVNRETIQHILRDKLAVLDRSILRLTDKGYPVCDEISGLLLSGVPAA